MGGGHSPNDLGPYSDGCNFFGASDINFFGAIPYLMKRPIILTIKKRHKMNLHYHLIFLLLDFDEAQEAVELKT